MNHYEQFADKAKKVKWKTEVCHTGEECWCRLIVPAEPLENGDEDDCIVSSAAIGQELAEYIVELHNNKIKQL